MAFAIEKRSGGHSFQINVGNGFGTTFAMARGGNDDCHRQPRASSAGGGQ
jgi:hypothetical protein